MKELSFNAKMVQILQQAILDNPLAKTVTVDGTTVAMADALERLEAFEDRLSAEEGRRTRVAYLDLGGGAA